MSSLAERQRAIDMETSLHRALILAVAVPLIFFLIVAAFDRQQILANATAEIENTANILEEHTRRVLDSYEMLIEGLGHRTEDMSWDEIQTIRERLTKEARLAIKDRPQVSNLAMANAIGQEWISATAQPPEPRNIAHREYWAMQRESNRGTFISRAFVGDATGKTNFGVSRRRQRPDGTFDGTIQVAIRVEFFESFWAATMNHALAQSVSLIRTDGEVLARFPPFVGGEPRLSGTASRIMSLLNAGVSKGTYTAPSLVDGVDRIVAFRVVGHFNVAIANAVTLSSILAPWWRHMLILAAICMLAALGLALAMLAAMRQTKRLLHEQALRAAAEQTALDGQRLELLGQLAAGVAHDFANVIQSVTAGASLIEKGATDDHSRKLARLISKAARQGEALTKRMLNVARRDVDQSDNGSDRSSDAGEAVTDACELVSRSLTPAHRLQVDICPPGIVLRILGRRADFEGAVMNLVVNARDACPEGGDILVRLTSEQLRIGQSLTSRAVTRPTLVLAGIYARIAVIDYGVGMTPDVLARASEPFFTTKPRGQGTGLGLASARGFADRAGGYLTIESVIGEGTTVTLWLPNLSAEPVIRSAGTHESASYA